VKTIAPAAMAAIEAGEAIVTGAVEITRTIATFSGGEPITPGATVALTWRQNTFVQTGGNDEARMGIAFLDSSGAELSLTWAAYAQPIGWTARTLTAVAPAGAVLPVRIYMDMRRLAGTNNDGYIDAISATLDGVPLTIANADAETGDASAWTNVIGGLGVRRTDPLPYQGTYYFTGGTSVHTQAYQGAVSLVATVGDALRLWGGFGPIVIGGNSFDGVGNSAIIQQTAGAIGGVAQGLTAGLSGVEPAALPLLDDAPDFRAASVIVYRLIFASDGKTLLDAHVFDRGRMDTIVSDETVGQAAAIMAAIESAARGLGRSLARSRSDADQRLINSADGYFKNTGFAPEKKLYWGGKRPAVA
jgi:hypothetical protein